MKTKSFALGLCVAVAAGFACRQALTCTNFLISKGASTDGSTMITYSADSHELYGALKIIAAGKYPGGAMLDIYEWDTGKKLGQIKQARETYAVVGNMNEHQVAVGETTFGGRSELVDPEGIVDYGSLMFIALQRSKTARQAVETMGELVAEYGYHSSGESLSVSDPKEVWIMEIVGKGPKGKGAVWVARKVPNGYISAHANQARIRQFPLNDSKNCLYAKDVISFARELGYYNGKDADFSFADTYAPLDYGALRFCEARVWSMFRRAAPSLKLPIDYVNGVGGAKQLPLWIKPDKKLGVHDVMELMRDHFEDSEFDLSKGVGAGPYGSPYRWRPLTWEVDKKEYVNDRSTSTQQTGFSFVAQSRSWLPDPIGGVFWFGVDDTANTVYVPMYCGILEAPKAYAEETANFEEFSWDSAFWVFNFVSNWAYTRYRDMIKDIQVIQRDLEAGFLARQPEIDDAAQDLYKRSPRRAREYLSEYSKEQAAIAVESYRKLGISLLVKYLDGNVRDESGHITHPGYPEEWYRLIAEKDGARYEYKKLPSEKEPLRAPDERCHRVPGAIDLPPVCFSDSP
jgi:dipeptidase